MMPARSPGRDAGFSLVELVIVVLILGILVAVGVPRYMDTMESAKADDAAATLRMIGRANRAHLLDRGSYVTAGEIGDSCNADACDAAATRACNLVACGYIPKQPWGEKPYSFRAGGAGTDCGFGGSNIIACAKRKASPAVGGTSSAKHQGWGYTMNEDEQLFRHGTGSPTPPSL